MTVVLISRDETFGLGLQASLKFLGYQVARVMTIDAARQHVASGGVDCVVLDDSISPDITPGFLEPLFEQPELPVFVLVAQSMEWQEIQLLVAGVADYLPKSVGIAVLAARMRRSVGLVRRCRPNSDAPPALAVSVSGQTATFGDRVLRLSHREMKLLQVLVRAADVVLSREALLDRVWGLDSLEFEVRTVDVAIARLRKKLADHIGVNPIETVPGVGYRYRTDTVRVTWADPNAESLGGAS